MATNFNTGSVSTPAKFSQREDLANFISNIVRDDVPFMSSIGKGKANAVLHEWSTDTLERPGANAVSEGAAFPGTPSNGPNIERLGNYSQIFTKSIVVSGSIEAVNKAGRKSEFKYQSEKRGKELMRDIEYALIASRDVKTAGNGELNGGARKFGGYHSWAPQVNTVIAPTTTAFVQATSAKTVANGEVPKVTGLVGDGSVVYTQGVLATLQFVSGTEGATEALVATNTPVAQVGSAFSLSQVDDVMQRVWQNGGKPTTLMMSPRLKRRFSTSAQGETANGNVRRNIDEKGKLSQSVTLYESDFGLVKVVPNYIMSAGGEGSGSAATHTDIDILVYDSTSFKMATLRPLHHRDISEDGDRLRALMVHETSVECMNPQAVGLITNLS